MKKIFIILIFILLSFVTGCGTTHPVITNIPKEVDEINKVIADVEYKDLEISDYDILNETIEKYNALSSEYKEYIVNFDIIVNSFNEVKELIEEEKITINLINELNNKLLENIPSSTISNITLPSIATINDEEINLNWTSSDPYTIYTNGQVINGRSDCKVTLKCSYTYKDKKEVITKDVIVKPITFNKLTGNNVFTYMYSSSFSGTYTESDLKTIDVVNLCFADIIDGEVDILSIGNIRDILSLRRDSKIRVCICITGYGSETKAFSDAASTSEGRVKLAKSIVDAIEKYHFDGIDIDWEYPGSYRSVSVDRANHALFMQTLYKYVKEANEDYIVSGALPGTLSSNGLIKRYDIQTLSCCMDYIHLMTYDMNSSSVTSHHTSYVDSVTSVKTYIDSGAKSEQLTIGVAYYGKQFRIKGNNVLGASCSNKQTISYDQISSYLNANNNERFITYWDDSKCAPYMEIKYYDTNGNYLYHDFITYDSTKSVDLKANYAKSYNLAGIMCWEYGENKGGELQKVIYNVLKK